MNRATKRPLWLRVAAGAGAAAILLLLGWFYMGFNGNPFTRVYVTWKVHRYVAENYQGQALDVSFASYDFKTGGYGCGVSSPHSQDTHFRVYLGQGGELCDNYSEYVASGFNTWARQEKELDTKVEALLGAVYPYPVELCLVEFQTEGLPAPALDSALELRALPAPFRLTVWVEAQPADDWNALAGALLDLYGVMEANGLSPQYYSVSLRWPRGEDGLPTRFDSVHVYDVPSARLAQPEGLADWMRETCAEQQAQEAKEKD